MYHAQGMDDLQGKRGEQWLSGDKSILGQRKNMKKNLEIAEGLLSIITELTKLTYQTIQEYYNSFSDQGEHNDRATKNETIPIRTVHSTIQTRPVKTLLTLQKQL